MIFELCQPSSFARLARCTPISCITARSGQELFIPSELANQPRVMSTSRSPSPANETLLGSIRKLETSVKAQHRPQAAIQHDLKAIRQTTTNIHHLLLESFAITLRRNVLSSRLDEVKLDLDETREKLRPLNAKCDAAKASGSREELNDFIMKHARLQTQYQAEIQKLTKERRRLLSQIQKLDTSGVKLAAGYQKTLDAAESLRTSKHLI